MIDFLTLNTSPVNRFVLLGLGLLALFLVVLSGCTNPFNPTPSKASSPYLPLKVGNSWTYRDVDRTWTASCNAAMALGGEEIFIVTDAYYGLPWENTYYYFNSSSLQVYIPIPFTSEFPPPTLITFTEMLRLPFTAGQSYTNVIGTWTVESLTDSVTVPAGSFSNVLRLRIEPIIDPDHSNTHILYLAPNVGLVKSVNPVIGHTIELQSYSVR